MLRASAMQSRVTSGCSCSPSSLKPCWQNARRHSAAPSVLCARIPRCGMDPSVERMSDSDQQQPGEFQLPAIPVSAGAMIFDRRDRLLILKPTYKSGWTIPGGVMEADGETPWQACRREVLEETG